jgi:hypothetical protein
MKEKMLMKLERDRLSSRVGALEAQLRQLEGNRPADQPDEAKPTMPRKPRGAQLPPDSRDNPALERDVAPPPVGKWGLAKTFQAHSASVSAIAVHPSKPIVATASDDGLWKMWSLSGGDLIMSGDGHKGWLSGISFAPGGRQLATSAEDGTVKIWDFEQSRCVQTLVEHTQVRTPPSCVPCPHPCPHPCAASRSCVAAVVTRRGVGRTSQRACGCACACVRRRYGTWRT